MTNKLFVGGLSWDTKEDGLREFFAKAGTVVSVAIITDKFSGKSKGFGFVEMSTPEEAEKAKQELNGQTLDGRAVSVNDARPQAPRDHFGDSFKGEARGGMRGRDPKGGRTPR